MLAGSAGCPFPRCLTSRAVPGAGAWQAFDAYGSIDAMRDAVVSSVASGEE